MIPTGNAGPRRGRDGLDRPSRLRHSARVAERGRDWNRLAAYVVDRRSVLGYTTRRAFSDLIGDLVEYRTLSNLERGKAVNDNTLAIVERFLKWTPGSCRAVLRGGEPTILAQVDAVKVGPDDDFRNTLITMRRAMGHEAFSRWVEEISQEEKGAG